MLNDWVQQTRALTKVVEKYLLVWRLLTLKSKIIRVVTKQKQKQFLFVIGKLRFSLLTRKQSSIEGRGPTNCILTSDFDFCSLTLTSDLDLQSQKSYGHDPNTRKKVNVKGHLLQKLQWKQTDGQTDRSDCITSGSHAVGKYTTWYVAKLSLYKTDKTSISTPLTANVCKTYMFIASHVYCQTNWPISKWKEKNCYTNGRNSRAWIVQSFPHLKHGSLGRQVCLSDSITTLTDTQNRPKRTI